MNKCLNSKLGNQKKVISPKGNVFCENPESKKHKAIIPSYSTCGKFEAISQIGQAQTETKQGLMINA